MTLRAMGAFNGTLPEPTGELIAFIRDPKSFAYLMYTQMIAAPEIQFMYAKLDPDESLRLVNMNEFGWGYDDYRPTGKSFTVRAEWIESRTQRWDFPYTLGEATLRVWRKSGIDPKMVYDLTRANHAALHRASRVVTAMTDASWGANTSTLASLLGTTGSYFDRSTGTTKLVDGTNDPNFQVIKKAFNRVKRRIHLATNGVVNRSNLYAVISPAVAQAMSESGEIFEALKQSQFAKEVTDLPAESAKNVADWNIPARYAGFNLVVEDTPKVFINQKADGTVADVTVASEKDYLLSTDTIYFVSRPGGLDGGYGKQNFSTVHCYHFGGEARVEAFSEPKHELIEGHVVMEDKVLVPAPISGFKLTDVLS